MNSGKIKLWKLSAFFGCVFSNGPVVFSKFFPQLWGVRVVHCRVLYTGLYGIKTYLTPIFKISFPLQSQQYFLLSNEKFHKTLWEKTPKNLVLQLFP